MKVKSPAAFLFHSRCWRILNPGILMTETFTTHIEVDDRNVAWIAGTKVKVTEVVLDKIAHGWSPEEIHFQHPNLSLAQIHGALTYYYEKPEQDRRAD